MLTGITFKPSSKPDNISDNIRAARWLMVLAGTTLQLLVDDSQAAYPLTIDPVFQQAYLKASNTDANDRFGSSVAITGDTVVVGAPREDSSSTGSNSIPDEGAADSGAAYVFRIPTNLVPVPVAPPGVLLLLVMLLGLVGLARLRKVG